MARAGSFLRKLRVLTGIVDLKENPNNDDKKYVVQIILAMTKKELSDKLLECGFNDQTFHAAITSYLGKENWDLIKQNRGPVNQFLSKLGIKSIIKEKYTGQTGFEDLETLKLIFEEIEKKIIEIILSKKEPYNLFFQFLKYNGFPSYQYLTKKIYTIFLPLERANIIHGTCEKALDRIVQEASLKLNIHGVAPLIEDNLFKKEESQNPNCHTQQEELKKFNKVNKKMRIHLDSEKVTSLGYEKNIQLPKTKKLSQGQQSHYDQFSNGVINNLDSAGSNGIYLELKNINYFHNSIHSHYFNQNKQFSTYPFTIPKEEQLISNSETHSGKQIPQHEILNSTLNQPPLFFEQYPTQDFVVERMTKTLVNSNEVDRFFGPTPNQSVPQTPLQKAQFSIPQSFQQYHTQDIMVERMTKTSVNSNEVDRFFGPTPNQSVPQTPLQRAQCSIPQFFQQYPSQDSVIKNVSKTSVNPNEVDRFFGPTPNQSVPQTPIQKAQCSIPKPFQQYPAKDSVIKRMTKTLLNSHEVDKFFGPTPNQSVPQTPSENLSFFSPNIKPSISQPLKDNDIKQINFKGIL